MLFLLSKPEAKICPLPLRVNPEQVKNKSREGSIRTEEKNAEFPIVYICFIS
jgi:hypothetical protein